MSRGLGAFTASLVLVAMTGGGCSDAENGSEAARVAGYLEAFLIERDWDRWPEFFAPGATLNGSSLALESMRGTAQGLHYSFADLSLEVREQIAEPGRVATLFVLRGRHEQPFDASPATHGPIELDGFSIDHFRDGKIVESTMILDVWGLSRRVAAENRARP